MSVVVAEGRHLMIRAAAAVAALVVVALELGCWRWEDGRAQLRLLLVWALLLALRRKA